VSGAPSHAPGLAEAFSAGAGVLRERFAVWGRFTDAVLDGEPVALRSHLELADPALDATSLRTRPADLVAVMMNPGASRPLADPDADGWAPAVPDRTQYQLMRLALASQALAAAGVPLRAVRHIRVLNLSDLRTPKSAELFALLARLRDDRHSMFSAARAAELAASLGPDTVPVLRAWGLGEALRPWARRAVAATASHEKSGLTTDGVLYRHPLPQRADLQQVWLAQVWPGVATALGAPGA
jgi:hypothetical protein